MKTKNSFLMLGACTLAALAYSSCSDFVEYDEETIKQTKLEQTYTEAFRQRFGDFDPEAGYGMDDIIPCMMSVDGGMGFGTRADGDGYIEVGHVNINRNTWVDHNNVKDHTGTAAGPYDDDALAHDIVIPGWPHLNGLYYGSNGGDALDFARTKDEVIAQGGRPVGDITEFEIQYVSAWFRTHRITNPEAYREKLHLSDFFIQNVSADADQLKYDDLPSGQVTGYNGANSEMANDVRQYPNVTKKKGAENSNERINYKLDQLLFKAIGGSESPNINSNGWTHALNFNNGNVNWNPEQASSNDYREILYITSSGTEDFACRSSMATTDAWDQNWVLVHLTWTETVKDPKSPLKGTPIAREGYYLAFDFETESGQTIVDGDGFYSNWIIKITPGHFAPTSGAKRVMCEDLGGSLDFDFNDAVFDVGFDKNGQTIVTVQATGATMPIYIGFDPTGADGKYDPNKEIGGADNTLKVSQYEIHNLLGNVSGEMKQINVLDPKFKTHAPAIFRGRTYPDEKDRVLSKLHMYVVNTRDGNRIYDLHSNNHDRMGFDDPENHEEDADNSHHRDYDDDNVAPRAFAVPIFNLNETVQGQENIVVNGPLWMCEYVAIDKGYQYFPQWCKKPDVNTTTGDPWYKIFPTPHTGVLYDINVDGGGVHGEGTIPAGWTSLTIPTSPTITKVSSLTMLRAWDGDNPMWRVIDGIVDENRQITYTIVMTRDESITSSFECILIPADYDATTTNITYQGFTRKAEEFPSVFTRWKEPTLKADIVEEANKNTYVVTFNFTKQQLYSVFDKDNKNNNKLCDYLLLYIKDSNGTIKPSDITVNRWFIHY